MSHSQPRFGIELRILVATALAGIGALLVLVGVFYEVRARMRVPVERRVLEAERGALRAYLTAPAPARGVVPFGDILVIIRAELIAELIAGALPIERTIDDRFLVRVDSARVTLRTGLALVELSGRARLTDDENVFADISLVGALEVGTALRVGSALAADVTILGVRTRDVGVGRLSPPAERLVDELARVRLSELDRFLHGVPIPVRLDELVELPAVEEEEVTIPAAGLEIGFRLQGVRVLEEGVFVSLSVERLPSGGPARPDSAAPVAPIVDGGP